MAPQLTEDEIDDLLYAARIGDQDELTTLLSSLSEREKVSVAEILINARDEGKSTCLHMATGNGHLGESRSLFYSCLPLAFVFISFSLSNPTTPWFNFLRFIIPIFLACHTPH